MASALAAFVRERRNSAAWLSTTRVLHVFLGNEASDADSIISSVCMAFLRQQMGSSDAGLCVPWLQCRRDEFPVRAETVALLGHAGIDPAWLVFKDSWALPEDPGAAGTPITLNLLDHNAIAPSASRGLPWAEAAVASIWDHHTDMGKHMDADPREIAFDASTMTALGSCCTLVAEAFERDAPHLLVPSEGDPSIALVLLGVILLDTAFLSAKAAKAQPRDVAAADMLAKACGMEGGATGPAAKALFEELRAQKFSRRLWEGLSLAQAVGADFKRSDLAAPGGGTFSVGYASILAPLDAVLRDADPAAVHAGLAAYCGEHSLDLLALLGFTLGSGAGASPARELALFAPEGRGAAAMEVLRDAAAAVGGPLAGACTESPLGFAPVAGCGVAGASGVGRSASGAMARWSQADVRASRKQIKPLLDAGLEAALARL